MPAAASLDSGQRIELSVIFLLDGTEEAVAKRFMTLAALSYAQRNIRLVLKNARRQSPHLVPARGERSEPRRG